MSLSTTSSEIFCPDFSKVLKDYKYRTDEKAQIAGVRAFKNLFNNSRFRRAVRIEKDTLDLIVNCGLAADIDNAKQIVDYMIKRAIRYSDILNRNFYLEKLSTRGNIAYRIHTFSSPSTA